MEFFLYKIIFHTKKAVIKIKCVSVLSSILQCCFEYKKMDTVPRDPKCVEYGSMQTPSSVHQNPKLASEMRSRITSTL
jgi:hypothetical protein